MYSKQPKSARPINCKPLTDAQIKEKYADRVRWGKTAKKRVSGKQ